MLPSDAGLKLFVCDYEFIVPILDFVCLRGVSKAVEIKTFETFETFKYNIE